MEHDLLVVKLIEFPGRSLQQFIWKYLRILNISDPNLFQVVDKGCDTSRIDNLVQECTESLGIIDESIKKSIVQM